LCQAKIAAAELWRAYSEHYRSHQARHPITTASRHHHHQQQQQQQKQQCDATDAGTSVSAVTSVESVTPTDATAQSQESLVVESGRDIEVSGSSDASQDEMAADADCGDVADVGEGSIASSNSNNNDDDVDEDDYEVEVGVSAELGSDTAVWNDHRYDVTDSPQKSPLPTEIICGARLTTEAYDSTAADDVDSSKTTMISNFDTLSQNVRIKTEPAASLPQGFDAVSDDQRFSLSTVYDLYNASFKTDVGRSSVFPNSSPLVSPAKIPKKSPGERQSSSVDYRRSERGLSFLFPSFSDHGMSLLDKVRITVARHKNNYFLGWTADQLSRLDPVVRPKVPVTHAVYREYCHRNAMKYDSNLQFACESPEPWAAEFRSRLTLPPAEGGFSSLCEVKLEAGRLWREHSGRYRMHNIVKWQMGMNSAVLANGSAATATVQAAVKPVRSRGKASWPSVKTEVTSPSTIAATSLSRPVNGVSGRDVELSVTAPSSVPLNLSSFLVKSAVSGTPRFADKLCLASTPAVVTPTPMSLCSSGVDMLVPASSGLSTDPGPLFQPLPDDMPAASQLRVWLDRHRRGYFVNAPPPPPSTLARGVVDYVRPRRWPVTPALLDAEIPPGVVEVLGKIDHLLSLPINQLPSPARIFRERLDAPAGSADAFTTFEEAVTEALTAWRTAVGQSGLSANGAVGSGGASRYRKRKRDRLACVTSFPTDAKGSASASDVRVSTNGGSKSVVCVTSDDDSEDNLVIAVSPSSSPEHRSPSAPLSVDEVQQLLWSSRSLLHDACVQNPQLSWNERIEPLRSTLTAIVGPDYVIPGDSHAAAVDLVLAVLQSRLDELAHGQLTRRNIEQRQFNQDTSPE